MKESRNKILLCILIILIVLLIIVCILVNVGKFIKNKENPENSESNNIEKYLTVIPEDLDSDDTESANIKSLKIT